MKKIVKTIQKNIEVDVCEICGSEDICITWDWYEACSHDACYEDWGKLHFCSFRCFMKCAKNIREDTDLDIMNILELDASERNNDNQSFTLNCHGQGVSDVTDFLKMFAEIYFKKESEN